MPFLGVQALPVSLKVLLRPEIMRSINACTLPSVLWKVVMQSGVASVIRESRSIDENWKAVIEKHNK